MYYYNITTELEQNITTNRSNVNTNTRETTQQTILHIHTHLFGEGSVTQIRLVPDPVVARHTTSGNMLDSTLGKHN